MKRGNALGGKSTTISKRSMQLELFSTTAESPYGVNAGAENGLPFPATSEMLKVQNKDKLASAVMTMDKIASDANLHKAFIQVKKNKGAPGPDGQTIQEMDCQWPVVSPVLRQSLLEGLYRPGRIRRVWIPKPTGGARGLGIPNVIDRIVQQATLQVLSPHYEKTFHRSSHGFRPGRSCHTAITEAAEYVDKGYEWVVDIDLEKFFDKVHHQRLLARLSQEISDKRVLSLIHKMLKSSVVLPEGVHVRSEKGTPQGGPLSPLLSNIVLTELDAELSRRGHKFVRYADDCNIYVSSLRAGQRVMASIGRFIEKRLRLKVNKSKSAVAPPAERHFVGFRLEVNPLTMNVEILLSKRSRRRIDEKSKALTPRNWGHSIRSCIRQLNVYLRGWMGYFRICTARERHTFSGISAHIRRRLRAIILKHWRRKRSIVRRLIKHGLRSKTAWTAIYARKRRLWALSHCPAVDRTLKNAYFAELGLLSLPDEWDRLRSHGIVIA